MSKAAKHIDLFLRYCFIAVIFFALQGRAITRYLEAFTQKNKAEALLTQADAKVKFINVRCKLQCFTRKITPIGLPPATIAGIPAPVANHITVSFPLPPVRPALTQPCRLLPLRAPPAV